MLGGVAVSSMTTLHLQTLVYGLTTILSFQSDGLPGFVHGAAGVALRAMPVYLIRMLRVSYGSGNNMLSLGACLLPAAATATAALSLLAAGFVMQGFFLT